LYKGQPFAISRQNGTVTIGNDAASATANTLKINGSVAYSVINVTGSNSIVSLGGNDYSVFITGTGSSNIIALPSATSYSGRVYVIVNHSSNTASLLEYVTANGVSSVIITAGATVQVMSNGTDWHKIN
jgi:hypothetical protein